MKYPNITIQLTGEDGNAFAILARCKIAMRRVDIDKIEVESFMKEATSGNYDNLLMTCTKWFNID